MVDTDFVEPTKKKKRKRSFPKTITFDEEVVPKHLAEQLLINEELEEKRASENTAEAIKSTKKRKKQKKNKEMTEDENLKKKQKQVEIEENSNLDLNNEKRSKKKKKQKTENIECDESLQTNTDTNTENTNEPSSKTKLSIRAQKRLKYEKLKEEKHLQVELSLQQKSLTYLSKWKHSRTDWKFEKLRQIWLQNNMLNEAKIPEKFWAILVEYLGNSKGKSKDTILKSALKVVEDESEDQDSVKVLRARDIIQNLSE